MSHFDSTPSIHRVKSHRKPKRKAYRQKFERGREIRGTSNWIRNERTSSVIPRLIGEACSIKERPRCLRMKVSSRSVIDKAIEREKRRLSIPRCSLADIRRHRIPPVRFVLRIREPFLVS